MRLGHVVEHRKAPEKCKSVKRDLVIGVKETCCRGNEHGKAPRLWKGLAQHLHVGGNGEADLEKIRALQDGADVEVEQLLSAVPVALTPRAQVYHLYSFSLATRSNTIATPK